MRCTRIIASIVFSSALLISLCFTSYCASYNDTLYVDRGVGYYAPINSSAAKWMDYTPTVSANADRFTFSGIEPTLTSGNYEYAFKSFAFVMYPNNNYVEFERGYVYTYNFQIRSTKVSDVSRSNFEFGVCDIEFNVVRPIGDVVYTYEVSGGTTYNYYVTATIVVDDTFNAANLPHPEEACVYLDFATEWSSTFTLIASNLSVKKAVGEEAYYEASLEAIQNLPNTEYDFILNKMPNAEGEIQVIQGDILDILQAYDPGIQQLVQIMRIDQAKPCVYLPQVSIPIVDIDVFNNQVFFVDDYLNSMNPAIMSKLDVVLVFIRLVFCVTFATFTVYKLARIEWWY